MALVYAGGCAGIEGRALIFAVDPQLVEGVARLVDAAEQPVTQIGFIVARGDAHVTPRELGHEWVVRLVLAPTVEVEAKILHERLAEGSLLCFGIAVVQARCRRPAAPGRSS